MRTSSWLPALALLAACKDGGNGNNNGDDTDPSASFDAGCILVDGEGGYANIADALSITPDGGTITLCETTTGAITVADKAVIIEGAGVGQSSWSPPVNEAAITVAAGGSVTVSGITFIENSRSGIAVDGGTLVGADLQILSPDNYGVEALDGAVTLERVEVTEATWGGFEVVGGTFSLTDSIVSGATAFSVHAADKANVTLKGNTFSATTAVEGNDLSDGSMDDGFAVVAEDAIVRTEGNSFVGNLLGDVFAVSNATVEMTDDTSVGAVMSLWFDTATGKISGFAATEYLQYGLVAQGKLPMTLTDCTFSTQRAASAMQTSFDDFSGSFGVIALGPSLDIVGGKVSGNNGAGIYQSPGSATSVSIDISGTVIDDNARFGLVTYSGEMNVTDVTVSNTVADDLTCYDDAGSIVCNMALSAWNSDLVMTGGTIANNEGFTFAPLFASATVDGTTFTGNLDYGVFGYQVAFSGTNLKIEKNGQWPLWFQNGSSALIRNSAFTDNSFTQISTWTDSTTGDVYRYESGYAGNDIGAFDSTLVLENNVHTGGDGGVYASQAELEIRGDTFTGYNDQVVYGYDSAVTIEDVTITDVGGYPLFCSSGAMEVSGLEITDINHQFYSYANYMNDELQYEGEGDYAGQGIYLYDCAFSGEDITIAKTSSRAIYAYDSSLEIDGLEMSALNAEGYSSDGAVYVQITSDTAREAATITFNNVEISDVKNGNAFYLSNSRTGAGDSFEITNAVIGDERNEAGDISNNAIYASGIDSFSMTGFDIFNTGASAIYLANTTASLEGEDGDRTGRIVSPGRYGIEASTSSVQAEAFTVEDATLSGLYLPSGDHALIDVVVTSAVRYGMECSSLTTFGTCDAVDVTGTLGDVYLCTCPK